MIEQELRETCRKLLVDGTVQVIIGYGGTGDGSPPIPIFVTHPTQVDRLIYNNRCVQNLTTYLTRKDVQRLGRPAIVVKGCDERTLVMLEKEAQIDRSKVHVIGIACAGLAAPQPDKCATCEVQQPRFADVVLGSATNRTYSKDERYRDVAAFLQRSPQERLEYWKAELGRCTRCYACRQVCPLCYCQLCIMDKNRPQAVDTSPHLEGNLAYHITRAFHLAARCVGCEECTRACPARIDLRLLNKTLALGAEEDFGFIPGMNPEAELVTGCYSLTDREDFIK